MRITSKPLLEIFMIEITGICNNAYTRMFIDQLLAKVKYGNNLKIHQ